MTKPTGNPRGRPKKSAVDAVSAPIDTFTRIEQENAAESVVGPSETIVETLCTIEPYSVCVFLREIPISEQVFTIMIGDSYKFLGIKTDKVGFREVAHLAFIGKVSDRERPRMVISLAFEDVMEPEFQYKPFVPLGLYKISDTRGWRYLFMVVD